MGSLTSSHCQSSGIPTARRQCPAARIFLAALISRLCCAPHSQQDHSLIRKPALPFGLLDRIKAILLASEGWSQAMISQALRIHESTVARHLSDYVFSEKLQPENGGSHSQQFPLN